MWISLLEDDNEVLVCFGNRSKLENVLYWQLVVIFEYPNKVATHYAETVIMHYLTTISGCM